MYSKQSLVQNLAFFIRYPIQKWCSLYIVQLLNIHILLCDHYYHAVCRVKVLLTSGLRTKGSQASDKKEKIQDVLIWKCR